MTTKQIAGKLVDFCRNGEFEACYLALYSIECISIEPKGAMVEKAIGLSEIVKKSKNWNNLVSEMHGSEVGDPIVAGNYFSVSMWNDITFKDGNRMQMDEIGLYHVKDGEIIEEQFFY